MICCLQVIIGLLLLLHFLRVNKSQVLYRLCTQTTTIWGAYFNIKNLILGNYAVYVGVGVCVCVRVVIDPVEIHKCWRVGRQPAQLVMSRQPFGGARFAFLV